MNALDTARLEQAYYDADVKQEMIDRLLNERDELRERISELEQTINQLKGKTE